MNPSSIERATVDTSTVKTWFTDVNAALGVASNMDTSDGWAYEVASWPFVQGVRYCIEVRDETGHLLGGL